MLLVALAYYHITSCFLHDEKKEKYPKGKKGQCVNFSDILCRSLFGDGCISTKINAKYISTIFSVIEKAHTYTYYLDKERRKEGGGGSRRKTRKKKKNKKTDFHFSISRDIFS